MRNVMKKLFAVCLVLCLMMGVSCAETQGTTTVQEIQKYGNLILNIDGTELLYAGYTYGDIIEVELAENRIHACVSEEEFARRKEASMEKRAKQKKISLEQYKAQRAQSERKKAAIKRKIYRALPAVLKKWTKGKAPRRRGGKQE